MPRPPSVHKSSRFRGSVGNGSNDVVNLSTRWDQAIRLTRAVRGIVNIPSQSAQRKKPTSSTSPTRVARGHLQRGHGVGGFKKRRKRVTLRVLVSASKRSRVSSDGPWG